MRSETENPSRLDISIVPILVGAINRETEVRFGSIIAPFLAREDTFCVVSSDFCHWYLRFLQPRLLVTDARDQGHTFLVYLLLSSATTQHHRSLPSLSRGSTAIRQSPHSPIYFSLRS